jgi:SAM-dependent methyltransferase
VQGFSGFPNLSVLDLSCGEGEILQALAACRCEVQGTHYREEDYIVRSRKSLADIPLKTGVDLQRTLPFDTGSFDAVLLIEVLEHLETHSKVIHEAARVLRPGGWLVFTTPNIFRLHSRLQFFLTGKHKLIRRRTGWDLRADQLYAFHTHPVDFPLIHTILHQAGFALRNLHFTRFKWKSLAFIPLWPIAFLACWLTIDKSARASKQFLESERDLNRWLCHPALLYSEQLLAVAVRQPGSNL